MQTSTQNIVFSIITVTYNCEKTLEQTILSVFKQSCQDYEYFIIDGQSTDSTLEIIHKYKSSLTSYISEKDNGIYDAMNKGIRMASGKWILFLNSGDLLVDKFVLEKVFKIAKTSQSDILYGDILIRSQERLVVRKALEPCNKHRMYFCHQTAFTRTEIMKANPFNAQYRMSADLYFFKHCYYKGLRFEHTHIPIVIYDRNGISNTNRLAGLLENISVVQSLDKGLSKYLFLLRLYVVIFRLKYWSKSHRKKL